MPLPQLNLDIFLEVLKHALPPVASLKNVKAIAHYTWTIDGLCLTHDLVKQQLEQQRRWFDVCYWDLSPPPASQHATDQEVDDQAVAIVNALLERCLKANSLTLVLRFKQGMRNAAKIRLYQVLNQLRPMVARFLLFTPRHLEPHHGAFGSFFSAGCGGGLC